MADLEQQINEAPRSEAAVAMEAAFSPNGWGTKLLTPIESVGIVPETAASAFRSFIGSVEVGETFTINELLTATELIANRRDVSGAPEDGIYLLNEPIKDARLRLSLFTRSVPGVCALLQACGGAELTVPNGITANAFLNTRLYILPGRDGDRLMTSKVVPLVRVGTVKPGILCLTDAAGQSASCQTEELLQQTPQKLTVSSADEEIFRDGFQSALAYSCSCFSKGSYYVNLASDLPLSGMLAGALGMFDAMLFYRLRQPPMRFQANGKTALVVPRPSVESGDVLYAFRPKCDQRNRPLPSEVSRLRMMLENGVQDGKIKSVLPLKKNALDMVQRICGEDLAYRSEQPFPEIRLPEMPFAVLAVLRFGEQAPGTKLGTFQSK